MSYRYLRPSTVQEALEQLRELREDAMPVAGGTNFVPDVRNGRAGPRAVVDISRLPMRYVRLDGGRVRLGALTTVTDLLRAPDLAGWAPVLAAAARQFAGHLIRNRATVAGNIADASPAADLVPPLAALGAEVRLISSAGERTLPLDQFITGVRRTARRPDELVSEVAFAPLPPTAGCSYFKHSLREAMAISVVSGAVVLDFSGGVCAAASIVLGAVAPVPVHARGAEAVLVGRPVTREAAAAAAARVAADISPISDVRATAEYRTWVAEALVRRHVLAAAGQVA